MEATTFSSLCVRLPSLNYKPLGFRGDHRLFFKQPILSLSKTTLHPYRRHTAFFAKPSSQSLLRQARLHCSSGSPEKYMNDESVGHEQYLPQNPLVSSNDELGSFARREEEELAAAEALDARPGKYKNRFLNFVRLGTVVDDMAESFFKSEIRRRLFVTALLIVVSRVGYFIPLPGYDRRLIPQDYLSFASGSTDELGDFTAELKLSFFQLGISPQIAASILMFFAIFCHPL